MDYKTWQLAMQSGQTDKSRIKTFNANACKTEYNEAKGHFIAIISVEVKDRSGDIIRVKGVNIPDYVPILWMHNIRVDLLPIGRALWTNIEGLALKSAPRFAETEFAKQVEMLYRDKILEMWSIRYDPIKWSQIRNIRKKPFGAFPYSLDITEWDLLEYSSIPVADNQAVGTLRKYYKSHDIGEILYETIRMESEASELSKAVIPYSRHGDCPTAPEGEKWNAGKEVGDADVDDLKKICVYVEEPGDLKGHYKLPHHKNNASYTVVWNGVKAAMGALSGARNRPDIPKDYWKGIYNHLAKHYKQFDKEPPPFTQIEKSMDMIGSIYMSDLKTDIEQIYSKLDQLTAMLEPKMPPDISYEPFLEISDSGDGVKTHQELEKSEEAFIEIEEEEEEDVISIESPMDDDILELEEEEEILTIEEEEIDD